MTTATPKYKGCPIELDGVTYVCPPLNFRALQSMQAELAAFKGGVDPQSQATVVKAVYLALKRNYSEITEDQVIDGLDLGNMLDIMAAVMDVSGMRRKSLEAAASTGAAADPSTGTASTPS